MKYSYPAIFEYDSKEDVYLVDFPDVEGCFTDGKSWDEACENAADALALMLWNLEEEKKAIPQRTNPFDLRYSLAKENQVIVIVNVDTTVYKKKYNNQAVKKTLTIPMWLDTAAKEANLNFSKVLQGALKEKLKLVD